MASKLIFSAVITLAALASQAMSQDLSEVSMLEKHEQWMAQYGRVYEDNEEKANRYMVFKENAEFNEAGSKFYKLGINQFTDLTNEEFRTAGNKYKPWRECKGTLFRSENVRFVPATMDWRKKGVVTPIKDQGHCGTNTESCGCGCGCCTRKCSTSLDECWFEPMLYILECGIGSVGSDRKIGNKND